MSDIDCVAYVNTQLYSGEKPLKFLQRYTGYSCSKLYQVIKGATEQLAKLEKVMATSDASNCFTYLQKDQLSSDDIKTYDRIVNELFIVREGTEEKLMVCD